MPRIFITNGNGPGPVTLTQLDLMTSEPELKHTGESMLLAYNELLVRLEGTQVGDHRLQNGLAAAVAGLSAKEFSDLPEDIQESHRMNFVRSPIHQQLAPDLIIYLGSPPPNVNMPATVGQILFADEPVESDLRPRDPLWEDRNKSPTAWGWTATSHSHFIFLSGIFAAWPEPWSQEPLLIAKKYKSTLLLYLKIALYHELAHHLRSLVSQFVLSVDFDSLVLPGARCS
jgi:hypothetical protein